MKVSKENLKKIFLGAVICLGGVYVYFNQMLGPLDVQEKKATGQIRDLEKKIKDAQTKIAQGHALEAANAKDEAAHRVFGLMQAKIPTGQPVAWLPTRWGEFFKAQGIPKQTYHSNEAVADLGIPGFLTSSWTLDIPTVAFAAFGKAVAGMENQDGLCQITKFQINAGSVDPENHRAQITFSTFVKSEK